MIKIHINSHHLHNSLRNFWWRNYNMFFVLRLWSNEALIYENLFKVAQLFTIHLEQKWFIFRQSTHSPLDTLNKFHFSHNKFTMNIVNNDKSSLHSPFFSYGETARDLFAKRPRKMHEKHEQDGRKSSPAVQAAECNFALFQWRHRGGHRLHQRIPLRHRPSRIVQHFCPVVASLADEVRPYHSAAHQLV